MKFFTASRTKTIQISISYKFFLFFFVRFFNFIRLSKYQQQNKGINMKKILLITMSLTSLVTMANNFVGQEESYPLECKEESLHINCEDRNLSFYKGIPQKYSY